MENVGVDIALEPPGGQRRLANQHPNHVCALSGAPIADAATPLPDRRTAMRPRRVRGEPAFIDMNRHSSPAFIGFDFFLEDAPFLFVRFWMPQRFL
jgi:hypothetical protein